MHWRYHHINIPTEIVRTVVAISELGSFSKAGARLGLSQPAISAQMKRLQMIVGAEVFERTANGISMTPRGRLVLAQAKKLLEANDQILSIGGADHDSQKVRLGLSGIFADQFLAAWPAIHDADQISIVCDHSVELTRSFVNGYLDIGCFVGLKPIEELSEQVLAWEEHFVWVRSRDFVLQPGKPIPLIGWPGSPQVGAMISALERAGLAYRFVLSSADHHVRVAAVAAGLGLLSLPLRKAVAPLVIAKDYHLPKLRPLRAAIFVRQGVDRERIAPLMGSLKSLAPPSAQYHPSVARIAK